MKYLQLILFCLFIGTSSEVSGQSKKVKNKTRISRYEFCWAITHPFIACKALKITKKVEERLKLIPAEFGIDKDLVGGHLDAFRHAYWMAALTSSGIKARKAEKLGIAHEKENFRQFKRGQFEDGAIPDRASTEMDLWNNSIGIETGVLNKKAEAGLLENIVYRALINGELKIIRKDPKGNYLDCDGNIILMEELRKWENNKCLVNSNEK